MNKDRMFGKQKTEEKVYALSLWKLGIPIAEIARDVKKSRETIYRWVQSADKSLANNRSRSRTNADSELKNKILECFVLLKRPSVRRLKEALQNIYFVSLSEPQVRRHLQRFHLADFRPTKVFDSLLRHQAALRSKPKPARGEAFAAGTSPKSVGHSVSPEI